MCSRSPLFLLEAKSILTDLLKRSFELFDLFHHFVEAFRLNRYLSKREKIQDDHHVPLSHPCQLNYTTLSDLDKYLHRLHTSCRLTKSSLRSLHAARMTLTKDYIVIDDEIYELSHLFQLQTNRLWRQFEKVQEKRIKSPTQIINTRYHSQRLLHTSPAIEPFVFLPEKATPKNNSHAESMEDYRQILILFRKISRYFHLLIEQLYGVHLVQDSHILQPIVVSIIQLLLSIMNKLKEKFHSLSPIQINRNQFGTQKHEEVCLSKNTTRQKTAHDRNDNRSFELEDDQRESLEEFDEDEFYRLANLQRDD